MDRWLLQSLINIHRCEVIKVAASAGAADGTLKVWDRRKLGLEGTPQAMLSLALHKQAIMRVEFMPTAPGQLTAEISTWALFSA